MWVKELPNGKYKYTERYYDKIKDKNRYVSTTLTKNSPQAHNKAKQILGEKIKAKQKPELSNIRFKELVDIWVNVLFKLKLSPSTKINYKTQAYILVDAIGNIQTQNLEITTINKVFLNFLNEGQAYNTVKYKSVVLTHIINFAIDYGYLKKTFPKDDIKVPKINTSIKTALTDKYLEPEEVDYVFKKLRDKNVMDIYYLFKIQLFTGMRFSEASALSLPQIDFERMQICINRQYVYRIRDFTLPKGNKIRTIAYNEQLQDLLKEIIERRTMLLKTYHKNTDLLIFNKKIMPYNVADANYYLKLFDFPKKLSSHIFRHTYITRMAENYIPPKLIAQQAGHSNTKMIDDIYAHFSKKMNKDLQKQINNIKF
ncbi:MULTISPECIES: tyrosine-type recombinase/integrase [Aerococcus]|uniref:tyrosine-type recombinase/integrase n=1 Tax=Aerococcus TaxID=1375 RepID=UPI0018A6FA67|nr:MULTISPECIES: site-specific integrase [Aerococcus]MCY3067645.1 site-specific integrase [Aerococcus mictus]MCY3080453.1 site-specific integrase [Aerococcus mictus]MDK8484516.1 site-specific integrase [Aerococcus urinae]